MIQEFRNEIETALRNKGYETWWDSGVKNKPSGRDVRCDITQMPMAFQDGQCRAEINIRLWVALSVDLTDLASRQRRGSNGLHQELINEACTEVFEAVAGSPGITTKISQYKTNITFYPADGSGSTHNQAVGMFDMQLIYFRS